MGVVSTQGYRGKLVDKLTGTILDQFSDEDIKVSTNILELFDLGEIPGTFTQQITLPGTKKNNAYFEQYYDISVWEPDIFNTNQVNEAYLDFDGFYLVNGYIQLNKVNAIENKFIDSYEVTLFGIISNFSIDTRTSFLTDLSTLSAYNHTASYDAITSSWGRGLFNGDIVYPMAEYGQKAYYSVIDFDGIDDNERALVVRDYKPAIRIKKVWDACFNEFGYTYTGSFWNQGFLNDVYMICNNNLQSPVYSPDIETFGEGRVSNVSGSTPISLTAATSASFAFTQLDYSYNNKLQLTGSFTKYTVDQKSTLDITLDLAFKVTYTGGAGSGMPSWTIVWVDDATGLVQDSQVLAGPINNYITTIRDSRVTTITETFNLKGVPLVSATLPTGTYRIFIRYDVYGTANFSVQLNPDAQNMCQLSIDRVRQLGDQQVIDIPSNMPAGTSGIKVIDFIRSVQKKFNLIIYPDKLNPNQFIVETFNNWYKQGKIKDFNKYINLKDKISFTPANQLGYKKVRFSDADDTDYIETLFKRTNNRVYGESNYYDSGSFYSQGSLDVVSDVLASGPLGRVPGSGYSGSIAIGGFTCTTYLVTNESTSGGEFTYEICDGGYPTNVQLSSGESTTVCSRVFPYDYTSEIVIIAQGDCTPLTPAGVTGSVLPVYIPYYIADANYTPAKVLPRLFYYNGLRNAPPYWIQGYYDSTKAIVSSNKQTQFPYFDNYSTGSLNGTASLFPQLNSTSLLYNNEQAVWGTTPTSSLVSEYWSTYLELLYNPRTRLVDASAVIGLADYFDLELNDIAEFRGNYYHLRAINDYNLTTGEANIQMLGPIISDTISSILSGSWAPTTDLCEFTYTASVLPFSVTKSFGFGTTQVEACSATSSTYYLLSNSIVSGSQMWNDVYLSNTASNGLYSSASVTYTVVNGAFNGVSASCYSYLSASGGQISQSGDYTYHNFTSSGTFTVVSLGNYPVSGNLVEYLVVAGGGGGAATSDGNWGPGGGGAGGFKSGSLTVTTSSYSITIGLGGAEGTQAGTKDGINGQTSSFYTIVSLGGGGGGGFNTTGSAGGSGGGGGAILQGGGTGTAGQGNNGGTGGQSTANPLTRRGGGGGGAGGVGRNSTGDLIYENLAGSGSLWLDGKYYAGGGAAGVPTGYAFQNNTGSAVGGGGKPGVFPDPGGTGSVNTGGGGGSGYFFGGPSSDGGAGGSGIVSVRYRTNG